MHFKTTCKFQVSAEADGADISDTFIEHGDTVAGQQQQVDSSAVAEDISGEFETLIIKDEPQYGEIIDTVVIKEDEGAGETFVVQKVGLPLFLQGLLCVV